MEEGKLNLPGFIGGNANAPAPDTYLLSLRRALGEKFEALTNDDDRARFWPVKQDLRAAFESHMAKAIMRNIIAQVFIGLWSDPESDQIVLDDPEKGENRPDLRQLQADILNLSEWND